MSGRVKPTVLRVVLAGLGNAMVVASRYSDRFRRQVTRDVVVEISTGDGVRRQFVFDAATRRMHLPRGARQSPDVALRFGSAHDALTTLISTRTVGRLVEGMNTGATRIDGNTVLLLWFWGLTRVVAPIGSTRRPRRRRPFPVRTPETQAPYARRIVTEPAVDALAADWPQAAAARAKLVIWRAPNGAKLPPG